MRDPLERSISRYWRSALYRSVGPYVPAPARRLGYQLAFRAIRPADVPLDEARNYLRSRERSQTGELNALLNRELPERTALSGEAERLLRAADSAL